MKSRKAWAVTTNGRIQVWPDGTLDIWEKKPAKDEVGRRDRVVRVEIREVRRP